MSEVEIEDEVEVVVMDDVGISTTTLIMEKWESSTKRRVEAIQDRGMTNLKYKAVIVKILGIILQNIEFQVLEWMRKWIMFKRRVAKMVYFY